MASSPAQPKSQETPKAAEAFRRYILLGHSRSLRKLADDLTAQNYYKTSATAMAIVSNWSSKFRWQERIEQASTEQAEQMLRQAADLDADTFLLSSKLLNERMKYATRDHADAIVKWRESVRKPAPKSGTSVNVKVSVEVRQLAEQMARSLGIDAEELLREAEAVAQSAWEA